MRDAAQIDRLLRRHEVEELVGLKKSAIYNRVRAGTFPAPVHLTCTRTARWRGSDITAWMASVTTP